MKCPECNSENVESWEFDYGVDPETGYADIGSMALCRDCKLQSCIEDFEEVNDGTSK